MGSDESVISVETVTLQLPWERSLSGQVFKPQRHFHLDKSAKIHDFVRRENKVWLTPLAGVICLCSRRLHLQRAQVVEICEVV